MIKRSSGKPVHIYFGPDRLVITTPLAESIGLLVVRHRSTKDRIEIEPRQKRFEVPHASLADLATEYENALDFFFIDKSGQSHPLLQVHPTAHALHTRTGDKHAVLVPYQTGKRRALAMRIEWFAEGDYEAIRADSLAPPKQPGAKPIWLIGERPTRAEENGFHLFRWLRQHRADQVDAYYVLARSSPRWNELVKLGHLIEHRSEQHSRTAALAQCLVGTHDIDYILPTRDPEVIRRYRGFRVLVTHGVFGIKNMVDKYGVDSDALTPDLITAISEIEKEIIVTELGHPAGNVVVTGAARFDSLLTDVPTPKPQILLFPTWRSWIVRDADLGDSRFLHGWQSLIRSDAFANACSKYSVTPTLAGHPNLAAHSSEFERMGIATITDMSTRLQDLMRDCLMLITDYSSIGFDFSFLNRPVVYYQFDQRRFFRRPPHLDLEHDLPGPIVQKPDEVVTAIHEAAKADFLIAPEYASRPARMIKYPDTENCLRIYEAVREAVAVREGT